MEPEQFGNPTEALNAALLASLEHGKGQSEIFGLRLQRHSFDYFIHQLGTLHSAHLSDKVCIESFFGSTLFIHLTRENKLEQAISYVRAQQTGLWHRAPDGTEIERLSEPKDPIYDPAAIASQLALSEQMDTEWLNWFEREGIIPLRITYDELSAAPYATLARVMQSLGLECSQTEETTPPTAKLADEISLEWAEKFRLEERE